jgi:hypothetical protein
MPTAAIYFLRFGYFLKAAARGVNAAAFTQPCPRFLIGSLVLRPASAAIPSPNRRKPRRKH